MLGSVRNLFHFNTPASHFKVLSIISRRRCRHYKRSRAFSCQFSRNGRTPHPLPSLRVQRLLSVWSYLHTFRRIRSVFMSRTETEWQLPKDHCKRTLLKTRKRCHELYALVVTTYDARPLFLILSLCHPLPVFATFYSGF